MSCNVIYPALDTFKESGLGSTKGAAPSAPPLPSSGRLVVQSIQAAFNLIAYILIGAVVGISLVFSYRNGIQLSTLNLHVVLCVIGYQLLMAVAILSLTSESGFSATLSLKYERRILTFLQVVGSVLAIVGSMIISLEKEANFYSIHGQTALAAMVFTTICLVNGITSLYAYEFRKGLPSTLSKVIHVGVGIVALVMANVSLCYGFKKRHFKQWATPEFTMVTIVLTAVFTLLCIINPFFKIYNKVTHK